MRSLEELKCFVRDVFEESGGILDGCTKDVIHLWIKDLKKDALLQDCIDSYKEIERFEAEYYGYSFCR
jgi:hypothetical protein